MQFTELSLDGRLVRALSENGIETCTRVQEESLVHSLAGRDVTVQSQTGTGKTIAFLTTSFQRTLRGEGSPARTLVVAPTRELAVQIEKEAEMVGKYLPHRVGCFYGGVGYGEQERMLREGVDMVIGTPGRLLDYAGSGKIDFRSFAVIIIDEADRLFDMGFIPDLRRIMRNALPPAERQTMLFSATLGERVKQLAWEYMNNPVSVEIEPDVVTVREVTQLLYHVNKEEKMRLLLGLYRKEQPQRALIFTNTKHAAEMVARRMEINGHPSRFIMGDLPQSKRLSLITDMKAGKLAVLVATDVAARGLHIDGVDLVVNYDLPEDRESYVHRIGRTARAGKSGKAVSLVCERYVYGLDGIETFINMKIPVGKVTPDLLPEDKSAGMGGHRAVRPPRRDERRGEHRGDRRPREGERRERRPEPVGGRRPSHGGQRGQSGSRPPGRQRVDRNVPLEERAEYYRRKHDSAGDGDSADRRDVPRVAAREPARDERTPAGGGRGRSRGGRGGSGGRAPTPAAQGPRTEGGSRDRRGGRPAGVPEAPKESRTPPPAAEAARPRGLLDRIKGIFRRKKPDGGTAGA